MKFLLDRKDEPYCFRMQRNRVFYVRYAAPCPPPPIGTCVHGDGMTTAFVWRLALPRSEKMMRMATNVAREKLVSLGTCFGKFTKGGAFHLQITCLEHLAQFAKVCAWAPAYLVLIVCSVGRAAHLTPGVTVCSTRCG